MKNYLKKIIRFLLPNFILRFITTRPFPTIVDGKTGRTSLWIWKMMIEGDHHRGDCDKYLIKKYGHIIDKGLQNKDRTKGKGLDNVKKLNEYLNKSNELESNVKNWASNIYNDYQNFQKGIDISKKYDPEFVTTNINSHNLSELIKTRRSVRYFRNQSVDESILNEIFDVVNWAPNSCNRQAIKLFVKTNSPDEIKELMKLNNGATCMNVPPVFVSVCFDTKGLVLPIEREVAYIDSGLGLQNLILMAHSKGIATCVLNWTHAKKSQEDALRKKLDIDKYHLVIANMVVGYPSKGSPIPVRSDDKDFVIWR